MLRRKRMLQAVRAGMTASHPLKVTVRQRLKRKQKVTASRCLKQQSKTKNASLLKSKVYKAINFVYLRLSKNPY